MSAEKGGGTSVWGIFPGKMSGEYFQGGMSDSRKRRNNKGAVF